MYLLFCKSNSCYMFSSITREHLNICGKVAALCQTTCVIHAFNHVMCTFSCAVTVFIVFFFISVLYICLFFPHTAFFSNVRSPILQLNYYFSNCHVEKGKLPGRMDRRKTVQSQMFSDYNVTLISFHIVHVRSQKHAVHLFLLLAGLPHADTSSKYVFFSAAMHLH